MRAFLLLSAMLVAVGQARAGAPGTLALYFIDVEGGQSTLIVTPRRPFVPGGCRLGRAGHGVSCPGSPGARTPTGYWRRRATRACQIDYLLITHFRLPDHDGG